MDIILSLQVWVSWQVMKNAPLNIDISKCKTQHKDIQLFRLRRKGKKHSNDIVNTLFHYQSAIFPFYCSYPTMALTGSVSMIILFGTILPIVYTQNRKRNVVIVAQGRSCRSLMIFRHVERYYRQLIS